MENHKEDNVTSHLSYNKLFQLCKKLNKELSKLKCLEPISKMTIYFIEIENKNLLEKI